MLELYLFINPLGNECYKTEEQMLHLQEVFSEKIRYKFIPLINMNTINQTAKCQPKIQCHSKDIYQAALDFKAACFQGNKRGRNFLMNLQRSIFVDKRSYSPELVKEMADQSNLDWEMFNEDRHSKLAMKSIKKDQILACEMNVSTPPTVIVYDYQTSKCESCHAYSFEGLTAFNKISDILLEQHHPPLKPYMKIKKG